MSDSLLKPVSLKYRSRQNVYGSYKMKWIYPTQYQTSYSLTGAGQIQNTYQIQSNVFNNSLSRVNFRITVPAQGAGTYINHYIGGQKAITNISYAPQGGVDLAPFANIDRLCDITARPEISYKELCAKDITQSFATAATMSSKFEGLTKCDGTGSNVCYLDGSNIMRVQQNNANVLTAPDNAAMIIDYSLPGDIFKNTILSLNRDIYFQNQTTVMFTFNNLNNLFWTSTSGTDPQTGAAYCTVAGATITNCSMEVAVQQNQAICDEVVALTKNGLEFTIPYIYSYNNSLPAGGMQFSFPITNAYGDRLTKIYAGFYPSAAVGLLYNKSNATANAGGIATGYGTNISSFTTYLNSVMLQYQQLVCANGDDYIFQKPYLDGSSVVSMNDYYNNWFWAEHFTGLNKAFLKDLFPDLDENNLVLGIPLSDQQITYQFNGTSNVALNSWVFFVTQRTVRIDGSNVSFTNMA